jgi:hypothetical protein
MASPLSSPHQTLDVTLAALPHGLHRTVISFRRVVRLEYWFSLSLDALGERGRRSGPSTAPILFTAHTPTIAPVRYPDFTRSNVPLSAATSRVAVPPCGLHLPSTTRCNSHGGVALLDAVGGPNPHVLTFSAGSTEDLHQPDRNQSDRLIFHLCMPELASARLR